MDRRSMLKTTVGAGVATLAAPLMNYGSFQLFAESDTKYSTRAIDLVQRSTVVDMLNPLSLYSVMAFFTGEKKPTWFTDPESFQETDWERFKTSGFSVLHIAVGTGGPDAYEDTLRFLALWNGFIAHHSDWLMRVDSPARLAEVKKSGKLGIILGIQNSEHFRNPDDVNFFYSIGQRVSQLTYNNRNLIGTGSTERNDSAISDFGVAIVERMNKLGMAVDVSHCGDMTSLDACTVSKAPVLITHSNCRALCPHPRCKPDDVIRKVASTGGVMGITGVRPFVKNSEPTTAEDVLNHYDHVAKLVGVEHVGIGSDIDLDGYDHLPEPMKKKLHAGYKASYGFRAKDDIEGFDHPKRTYDLVDGLIRRGYSDSHIQGILGGNFNRVLTQIWGMRTMENG
ncbi:MAG TPA: membrane dipeptidase [Terriglobales bacterium]|nr:membrane dipeptidase [Terriglobales bacterium]